MGLLTIVVVLVYLVMGITVYGNFAVVMKTPGSRDFSITFSVSHFSIIFGLRGQ